LDINSLYDSVCDGDESAVQKLFELLNARFRLFARRQVWDNLDAEEIVQEALMTVSKEYRSLTIETSFAAWAYKVIDNRIKAYRKNKKRLIRRSELLASDADAQERALRDVSPSLKQALLECLHKVGKSNRRYARVLNLSHQGYGADEICRKMNLTRANLYSILSRARTALQACLERGELP